MPFSLHGKTSLIVTELDRERLDDFDPLRDAVPDIFPDDPVLVRADEGVEVELRGDKFSLGGVSEVPTFAAVFLLCRKEAVLAD